MKFPKLKLSKKRARLSRRVVFAGVALIFGSCSAVLALTLPQPPDSVLAVTGNSGIHAEFNALAREAATVEEKQRQEQIMLVSHQELQQLLNQVRVDMDLGQYRQAKADMHVARATLASWRSQISERANMAAARPAPGTGPSGGIFLPVVLYHYTPPNFDAQLTHLEQAGYSAIDLDQAWAGLHGGPLPAKPVVITFDDGFANQLQAFEILKNHRMKATFYIINGGEKSHWCLGAGRRYGDPSQPPGGCGDAYLNWDQVRMLDQSGLITIGGHTLDHENLASLPAAEQQREIVDSKTGIERELGHPIKHFAYPYGAYNAESVKIVQQAGYDTAVTTEPGTHASTATVYTMPRIRDTLTLP